MSEEKRLRDCAASITQQPLQPAQKFMRNCSTARENAFDILNQNVEYILVMC
jgi:hypothetical protein